MGGGAYFSEVYLSSPQSAATRESLYATHSSQRVVLRHIPTQAGGGKGTNKVTHEQGRGKVSLKSRRWAFHPDTTLLSCVTGLE